MLYALVEAKKTLKNYPHIMVEKSIVLINSIKLI